MSDTGPVGRGRKACVGASARYVLVAAVVPLLWATLGYGQITMTASFDHGALDLAGTTITPTDIILGPRTDIYISRWIYCRASGLLGLDPEFRISNAHIAGYSLGDGHRYVFSYNQYDWQFFDNGENRDGYYRFSNDTPFSQDSVWLAYALPYPWAATENHINDVGSSPWVSPTPSADAGLVLGLSNDGTLTDLGRAVPQLDVYGYKISDASAPGPKTVVVFTTGNHPNETPGTYTFEGAVDFLLSADARAAELREVADFYVYPNCNPDGRWAGHARSNPENPNIDHNRDWDDPVLFTDLAVLTTAMKADTNSSADYFFDFHAFNNNTNVAIWIYAEHSDSDFVAALATQEPTMQFMIGSSPPDSPGVSRHWAHSPAGLNAEFTFTPETGFLPGWQADDYRALGESYALALHDALLNPGCDEVNTSGVTVYEDGFDAGTSGVHWDLFTSSDDFTADFGFDYSAHGIPPAPNSVGGTTIGAKFTVNNNDADPGTEALSAYPLGVSFGDEYALKFDMWINYNGGSGGGTGSTEFMLAGINQAGTRVNWPENPASDGISFAVSGEGDAETDYRAYEEDNLFSVGSGVYAAGSMNSSAPFYQSLFTSPTYETPGSPGKHWVEVEIRQASGELQWLLNGTVIATIPDPAYTSGNVMIGYYDGFASIAYPGEDNFIIYDNVRVIQLTESDCNSNGIADVCEVVDGGDYDADEDIDLDDLAALIDCLSGPDVAPVPAEPTCAHLCLAAFDFDDDQDVDLRDYAEFHAIFDALP
ncbi:MAG: carboxypeptidase family protein [bacterium]|nr:carboxypeptidase family protein [bacterium]